MATNPIDNRTVTITLSFSVGKETATLNWDTGLLPSQFEDWNSQEKINRELSSNLDAMINLRVDLERRLKAQLGARDYNLVPEPTSITTHTPPPPRASGASAEVPTTTGATAANPKEDLTGWHQVVKIVDVDEKTYRVFTPRTMKWGIRCYKDKPNVWPHLKAYVGLDLTDTTIVYTNGAPNVQVMVINNKAGYLTVQEVKV